MISVLLPSRNRPDMAEESIKSLIQKNNELEILLWLDKDDKYLSEYITRIKDIQEVNFLIYHRYSYANLYKALNKMIKIAKYDWYMLWNDDVYMRNSRWFEILKSFIEDSKFCPLDDPIVINFWNSDAKHNLFPMVSRKFCDVIGHFSLHCANDSWIENIAFKTGIGYSIEGIKPVHNRFVRKDSTVKDMNIEKSTVDRSWGFFSKETQYLLSKDIEKVNTYLSGKV